MKVKVCPECGSRNAADAWACRDCGEALPLSTVHEVDPPADPGRTRRTGSAAAGEFPSSPREGSDSFRLSPSGLGVAAVVLSLVALLVGLGFLIHGVYVGDSNGVIRLADIYLGLGIVAAAVVFALWAIWERLGRIAPPR